MDVKEKLVELLDNFPRDLSPFAGKEKLFVIDDNIEQAEYLITNGVTVQEWIPVTERLPEENGIYLTLNKKRQYEFHMFQTGKRMWQGIWEEDGVTHWMPLPQPPKEE